ncbi:putative transcription factor bHLH family [Dioscorea sansibarensis]
MAQESLEASVASSSSTPSWWPELHANPISSWQTINQWQPQSHHSTSSCDEEISASSASFANTAGHSGLSMDSPPAGDLSQEPVAMENQLWNQVLLRSVGSGGHDMHQNHEERDNFHEVLSSKRDQMFNPACDYLKKMDNSWEINNPHTLNSLEKQLNSYNNGDLMEHQRLTNLSDLVSNWSIAPPDPHLDHHQIAPSPCFQYVKYEIPNSLGNNYPSSTGAFGDRNSCYLPYMHEIKMENRQHDIGSSEMFSGYQIGLSNTDVPWSGSRNTPSDFISFKPVEFRDSKITVKSSDSSTRGSGRSTGTTTTTTTTTTSEGKKKRSEDNSETLLKKTKHENSNSSSSLKLQVPKVKLADRITALQQIVSPFGKTDTASVLMEAINYIKFLQEQIQLLSDPYMKSNANKDHNAWGGIEQRKDKGDQKFDLRSRGLCVVPVSCTPEIYKENNGPDYWTPTYRGCLYR